ncbi:MAG: hypothetical protein AAGD33_10930 [Actinomycetota bacterium]
MTDDGQTGDERDDTGRDDARRFDLDDGLGLDDLDALARRAVDSAMVLVRRASSLGLGVLLFATVAAIGGFLLGLAALSDGIRTVWIVLGGFFMVVAIGTVLTAVLRLRSVRRTSDELVVEVREFLDRNVTGRQAVIDTVALNEDDPDRGVVDMSRSFVSFRSQLVGGIGQFRRLGMALTAVTSFPGLLAISVLVSFVFVLLAVIFGISLLL